MTSLRVRYRRMELSNSEVEIIPNVDGYETDEMNNVVLMSYDENGEYQQTGVIHQARWDSIMLLDEAIDNSGKE